MAQTVGQRLIEARSKQGFSIEDVAHKTRIRPHTLRDIEADDYSNFPNLTYAKSFLNMYSDYLGVDVSDFTREFGPANAGTLDAMAYLDPATTGSNGDLHGIYNVPARSSSSSGSMPRGGAGGHPVLLFLILLGAIGAAYGIYHFGSATGGDAPDPDAITSSAGNGTNAPSAATATGEPEPAKTPVPDAPPTDPVPTPSLPIVQAGVATAEPIITGGENGEPKIARPVVLEMEGEDNDDGDESEDE